MKEYLKPICELTLASIDDILLVSYNDKDILGFEEGAIDEIW